MKNACFKMFPFLALFALSLGSCNSPSENEINIPEGEYTMEATRNIQSLLCGMSETTFGRTILIDNGEIETHPLKGTETVRYSIKRVGDAEYIAKVHRLVIGDTITIDFTHDLSNNQLCFSCNGEKIIYQK